MTRLRPLAAARGHPIAVGMVIGVIVVQAIWMVEAVCPRMTMTQCLVAAIGLVAAISGLAIAVRAGWLAVITTRALIALPRAPIPASLQADGRRAGIARLRCLAVISGTLYDAHGVRLGLASTRCVLPVSPEPEGGSSAPSGSDPGGGILVGL